MTMKCDLGEARAASTYLRGAEMQRIPELRFSVTLGEKPEVELALV